MAENVFVKYVQEYTDKNNLKPGQLEPELIEQFFRDGYLQISNFFNVEQDLEPCKTAVGKIVDEIAQKLYKAEKIKHLYENEDVFHRLPLLDFPGASVLVHKYSVMPEEFMKLWTNEKLLNVVEQLIGPDIAGHPVWNLRPKAPLDHNQDVPWHQDNGYMDTSVDNVLIITAWIPLLDASATNGCLQVLKGGHKVGKVAPHLGCWEDTWQLYLDPEKITSTLNVSPEIDCVTVPVPYGGLLLFSNVLPHRSLPNQSDMVRWSLDLRWQSANSHSYGFHGIKDGLIFRNENQTALNQSDWENFNVLDRHNPKSSNQEKSEKNVQTYGKVNEHDEEFDTTITPFWMDRWPMIHENRHTARLSKKL